jgi:hypothetical protein
LQQGVQKILAFRRQVILGEIKDGNGGGGVSEDALQFLGIPAMKRLKRLGANGFVLVLGKDGQGLNLFLQ